MRVIRIAEVETVPIDTATPVPGWTGGEVRRTRQPLLPEGASENFSSSVVNFERGATTGWHTHTSDQILVITLGNGIVANEHEELHVGVGDMVQILPGENHWHGARADSYMAHITITSLK
jgi:quercetin dioxygenase-like cupin family protein